MGFRSYQIKPNKTPNIIKYFLSSITLFTLAVAIFPNNNLLLLLGLSLQGIKHFFIWQFITNLFIIPNFSISFSSIIYFAFTLYIIWMFSTSIIEIKNKKKFTIFLSTVAILSSIFAYLLLHFFSYPIIFFGSNIFLYSLATFWLMLNGDAKLFLFFAIPFKAKWLILAFMSINILSLISNNNYLYVLVYLFTIALSYFLSLTFWKTHSPFKKLYPFEKKIINLFQKFKILKKNKSNHKIFDFNTGKPIISDEEFMEKMLAKISMYGIDSLSKKEKKRMDSISSKKKA